MKKILVMCHSDPNSDPRPNRMIRYMKEYNQVSVLARKAFNDDNVESLTYSGPALATINRANRVLHYKFRQYDRLLWSDEFKEFKKMFKKRAFDIIVSHDLHLVPLALEIKNHGKVLFDAREYYPRHFEDQFLWRFICQHFNEYMCQTFLKKCDKVITVSRGIAKEYERKYGINVDVIESLPEFHDILPSNIKERRLNIIHHGTANPSRRIEIMIKMMDYVDDRFTLDLMLMPVKRRYYRSIMKEAKSRRNVKVIEPVPYDKIIPFTNKYDVGVFLVPPVTFNLKHTLPNKFFEFIQARLAVAIGPSVEMKPFIEQYNCGIVSKDFKPETLAELLNSLSGDKLRQYKENSHKAALELSWDVSKRQIERIMAELTDL